MALPSIDWGLDNNPLNLIKLNLVLPPGRKLRRPRGMIANRLRAFGLTFVFM